MRTCCSRGAGRCALRCRRLRHWNWSRSRSSAARRLEPVAFWAHARREPFDEHAKTKSPIGRQALDKIGAIFAVEREINGRSAEVRLAVRQAKSVPLLADLKDYLGTSLGRISRKGELAKAIRYSLNRWEALCRFTEDGRLEMTNNATERASRPLTLG